MDKKPVQSDSVSAGALQSTATSQAVAQPGLLWRWKFFEGAASWGTSAVVHTVGLVMLACWSLSVVGEDSDRPILSAQSQLNESPAASLESVPSPTQELPIISAVSPALAGSLVGGGDLLLPPLEDLSIWEPAELPEVDPLHSAEDLVQPTTEAAQKGPKAQFFGTTAYGSHFVFLLDVSGSMREGNRFQRALEELIRSIQDLNDDQMFYVALFHSHLRPMFDSSPSDARLLAATEENKALAATWLRQTRPGGGTDPREAIDLALRLAPHAIFLLSDGEFKTGRPPSRQLGSETLRVVKNRPGDPIPFHTLAYEDLENRKTLEALARITGGTYRYIPAVGARMPARAAQSGK